MNFNYFISINMVVHDVMLLANILDTYKFEVL